MKSKAKRYGGTARGMAERHGVWRNGTGYGGTARGMAEWHGYGGMAWVLRNGTGIAERHGYCGTTQGSFPTDEL